MPVVQASPRLRPNPMDSSFIPQRAMNGPSVEGGQQLLIFRGRSREDAHNVIQAVRDNSVVVLDTGTAEPLEAQRLVDFVCGGMDGLDGQIFRIDETTFLLAPSHAQVTV